MGAMTAIVNVIMEVDRIPFPEEMKAEFIFAVERSSGLKSKSIIDKKSDLHLLLGREIACNTKETSIKDQACSKSVARPNSPVSVACKKKVVRLVCIFKIWNCILYKKVHVELWND